uniref:Chromosome 19 open reading frame 25 n=1 Tax=Crocodylus porosus TaxID=8502 RepID=A0A7M4FCM0_CROPO
MSTKAKKRVVLPTRPAPPAVEQILEDVQSARPTDPVFALIELPLPRPEDSEEESERLYRQSHAYVEMNQRLQKACSLLKEKCEELRQAGETLEQNVLEMKQKAV